MLNDKEVKKFINHFQKTQKGFEKIKEILSNFIYQFPAIAFECYDDDIKGDFYLYVLDRLKKTISNYKIQNKSQFKTYFYLVLRRFYLNFIHSQNENKTESLPNEIKDEKPCISEKIEDLEKISLALAALPPKLQLILKLRCPDFLLPEDFFALGNEFKKDPTYLLDRVKIIFEDIKKKEKNRFNKKNKQEILLSSPKAIGDFLEIKANKVSKWLLKIKSIINEEFGGAHVPR